MSVAIIRFPGTNCEYDTKYAFDQIGAKSTIVNYDEKILPHKTKVVVLPGGFSYGDYLRSGALAKMSAIMSTIKTFASNGGYVLGICNGFQILTEVGLLPGALKRNDNLHFISKFQYIKTINNNNKFLNRYKKDEVINIPVAHHDGAYYIDQNSLQKMKQNEQILFKYCTKDGNPMVLNGSIEQIAGVCNKDKNIFGLMPHPERAMEMILGSDDGKKMIEALADV